MVQRPEWVVMTCLSFLEAEVQLQVITNDSEAVRCGRTGAER